MPEITPDMLGSLEVNNPVPETPPTDVPFIDDPSIMEEPVEETPEVEVEETMPEEGASPEEITPSKEVLEAGKKPYTPEEIELIMASEGEVDTDRLSPEGQAVMKQLQRVYTKKFQSLADEKRSFEQKKTEQAQQSKDDYLYNEFKKDPERVIGDINAEIGKLKFEEYDEENKKKIEILTNAKEKLFLRKLQEGETVAKTQEIISRTNNDILSEIPDFKEKQPKLTELGKTLGFSDDELVYLTNPLNTGKYAAKLTKVLNKVYDLLNTSKTAEKKQVKPPPTALVRPGSGGGGVKTKDPSEMTYQEYKAMREKKEKSAKGG
jgi:hypothetical protein